MKPYMKRKKSKKSENMLALSVGGKVQKGSGCVWYAKGDVTTDNFLFEAKITEKPYYDLEYAVLQKIEKQALTYLKTPVLSVSIDSKHQPKIDFVVIPENIILNVDLYSCVDILPFNKSVILHCEKLNKLYTDEKKYILLKRLDKKNYMILLLTEFLEEFKVRNG